MFAPEYTVDRLENGVVLIMAPLPARQSVSVSFAFAVGSRYESQADAGLAHFIEHMVFKGSESFPSAGVVSEAIEGVGGVLNAATDREETVFWARVPQDHLARAAAVLGDMLRRPLFEADEARKERAVVIEELKMYQDSPQDYVQVLFDEVMWPDHPLGWDVAGREETVGGFGSADCRRHLDSFYRPERLVVTVTGAFEREHCRGVIDEVIAGWERGSTQPHPSPAMPVAGVAVRHANRRTEQTNLVVGVRGPSYLDEERHAVDILNVILGEGMSSRLFLEIRERQGLAYDVHSFTSRLQDTGTLGIGIGCEPKRAAVALRAALGELQKLATDPVPASEMTKAKEYSKGRLGLHLESTSGLGGFLSQQQLLTGKIVDPGEMMDRLNAVTAEEVRDVSQRLLLADWRGAVVGPYRDASRFEEILAGAASSLRVTGEVAS